MICSSCFRIRSFTDMVLSIFIISDLLIIREDWGQKDVGKGSITDNSGEEGKVKHELLWWITMSWSLWNIYLQYIQPMLFCNNKNILNKIINDVIIIPCFYFRIIVSLFRKFIFAFLPREWVKVPSLYVSIKYEVPTSRPLAWQKDCGHGESRPGSVQREGNPPSSTFL